MIGRKPRQPCRLRCRFTRTKRMRDLPYWFSPNPIIGSAPSVGGVTEWPQQQGNVKMCFAFPGGKHYLHQGIQSRDLVCAAK